ncbi:hypothetical protein BC332_33519 [Capsicum chinense]|nr:hypothetical protein BC332_33519 [Capsicum chinense]
MALQSDKRHLTNRPWPLESIGDSLGGAYVNTGDSVGSAYVNIGDSLDGTYMKIGDGIDGAYVKIGDGMGGAYTDMGVSGLHGLKCSSRPGLVRVTTYCEHHHPLVSYVAELLAALPSAAGATGKRVVNRSKKMDVDGTKEVHLQDEIIMDILSRLPVLALLRFKCVSKCWMTLISEPYFTLKHLYHTKNNQNSPKDLVLHGEFPLHCSSLSSASLSSVQLAEDVRKLDWPSNPRTWSISNEVYGEIPLPEGMSLVFNMNRINGVSALEGMLCVYSTHIRQGIHTFKLWILKDYDVKESWNQLFTIQGKRVMKHSVINKMDVDGTMEILSRLPVRSLLRFKCVSKFWMTLISETYFTLKHLNRAKNDQNSQRFLVSQWSLLYCSSLLSVQRIEEVQKLDCPSNTELWRCFLYCCYDSLLLIGVYNYRDHTHELWLWNPSTRESIVLPGPKFPPELFCTWGLGYDSFSDDYKIRKIDLKSCSEILKLKSGS